MPRKRMLDPALWDDPDLAQLTPIERLLFIGLISLADDYGHVSAHPALLRKWIFGYDDISTAEVQAMRNRILSCCRNVELYAAGNQEYLWLKTWERHQDLRYRAKAQCPCHACGAYHTTSDYDPCKDTPIGAQSLRSTTQGLAQPLRPDYVTLHDDTLIDHVQSAPDGAEIVPSKPPKRSIRPRRPQGESSPQGFTEFWQEYPRKKARAEAEKAYEKALKNGITPENLRAGAANYALECQMVDREERYICLPASFLNKRRFEDYQQPPEPSQFEPRYVPPHRNGRDGPLKQVDPGREYPVYHAPPRELRDGT